MTYITHPSEPPGVRHNRMLRLSLGIASKRALKRRVLSAKRRLQ